MFFDYFREICTKQNTTPTAVVKKLGLSTGKVTAWKNGSIPKNETLQALANALNVPVCALFGGALPGDRKAAALPEDEAELLDIYRQLGKSGKRQLIGKAYELLDAQTSQHSGEEITPPDISVVTAVHNSGIKK